MTTGCHTVFLMYHELGLPTRPHTQSEPGYVRYIVDEADFRMQMCWLQKVAWRAMSVGEALTYPPQPGVVVTFDDGCETDLIAAAPVLKEKGYSATFYVTVGFLGKPGFLCRDQLRQLSALEFEIGCHSMTHAYLNDLDSRGLHHEIVNAKSELEQILGKSVEHFSCPGGRYNRRVLQIARDAGYLSLTTSQRRSNSPATNPFVLGRVTILRNTPLRKFQEVCRGQGLWKLRVRDSLRDAAKTVLGNPAYDRLRALLLRN
jgi:hypothetical protein